ncbi:MAG TPA: 16S rRNA (guanine(527)-N(7))-methyltransferase RsmG [Micromonosporaceae bacterium]|nr:16S rRNA (guanine(527)-N(7))-methyltransferase RsmG [Micromonosporaceae bacterium]
MPMYDAAAAAAFGPGGSLPPGPLPSADARDESSEALPADGSLPTELAEAAHRLFGERLDLASAYAKLLVTDGVVRGLIGPREAPRIWARHLLNCAAVVELIPPKATLTDVGSGAGLPGLVLAVARPDLAVTLVEPLARRATFLSEVVAKLDLEGSVTVVRARAEELVGPAAVGDVPLADIVTARAVAPLDRLAGWCLPLAAVGGRLLALKGASAADEVAEHRAAVERLGGGTPVVRRCGVGLIEPPTTVVEVVRANAARPVRPARKTSRSRRRSG